MLPFIGIISRPPHLLRPSPALQGLQVPRLRPPRRPVPLSGHSIPFSAMSHLSLPIMAYSRTHHAQDDLPRTRPPSSLITWPLPYNRPHQPHLPSCCAMIISVLALITSKSSARPDN